MDVGDYEGGLPDIKLPVNKEVPSIIPNVPNTPPPVGQTSTSLQFKLPLPSQKIFYPSMVAPGNPPVTTNCTICGTEWVLPVPRPMQEASEKADGNISNEEDKDNDCHTFCPKGYCKAIIDMMERHYCAHPMIPGYAVPEPSAIKQWAVQEIYDFCKQNNLPEMWVYIWENWYQKGQWELWARLAYDKMPVLKTTMILESQ